MATLRLRCLVGTCLALLLVACAPRADVAASPAPVPTPAPVSSPAAPTVPGTPDASCRVASDCEVKNVGNCCGHFPACVNKDATVDPDAVRAQCERNGMASVCGWQDIQSCDCVQNQCRAVGGTLPVER
ncbi:hypothetical protein [Luteimonas sp. A482]